MGWKFPWTKKKRSKDAPTTVSAENTASDTVVQDPEVKDAGAKDAELKDLPNVKAEEVEAVAAEDVDLTVDNPKEETPAEEPKVEDEAEQPVEAEATPEAAPEPPAAPEATELAKIEEEEAEEEEATPDAAGQPAAPEATELDSTVEKEEDVDFANFPAPKEDDAPAPEAKDALDATPPTAGTDEKSELPKAEEKKGFLARVFPRSLSWAPFCKSPSFNAKDGAGEKLTSLTLLDQKDTALLKDLSATEPLGEAVIKVEDAGGQVQLTFATGAAATGTAEPESEKTPDTGSAAALGGAQTGGAFGDATVDEDHVVPDEGTIQTPVAEAVPSFNSFAAAAYAAMAVPLVPMGFMIHPPPEPPRTTEKGKGGAFPTLGAFPQAAGVISGSSMGSWVPPVLNSGVATFGGPIGGGLGPNASGFGSTPATPLTGSYAPRVLRRESSGSIGGSTTNLGLSASATNLGVSVRTAQPISVTAARPEGSGVQRQASAPGFSPTITPACPPTLTPRSHGGAPVHVRNTTPMRVRSGPPGTPPSQNRIPIAGLMQAPVMAGGVTMGVRSPSPFQGGCAGVGGYASQGWFPGFGGMGSSVLL